MTWYIVVTKDKRRLPIDRFATLEGAGNKIYRERSFDKWTVLAQDGTKGSAPARELTKRERLDLERCLYPSLYE